MKTFRIEWHDPESDRSYKPPEWKPIQGEEWSLEEHAQLRMKAYWEKIGFPVEFRVTSPESPPSTPPG